jgi:hypothetical protein
MKELDRYEHEGIDDEAVEEDPEARRKAERELEKREREQAMVGSVEDFIEDI